MIGLRMYDIFIKLFNPVYLTKSSVNTRTEKL